MAPRWKSELISVPSQTENGKEYQEQTVAIPCSGWYGISFDVSSEGIDCGCTYALRHHNEDNVLLLLPQRLANEAVCSIKIGTLVYLEQSSSPVTVSRKTCQVHRDNDDHDPPPPPPYRWHLFLQYQGQRDAYPTAKTLICAECCRMFASLQAIQCHIESMHPVTDPSSIWRKPLVVVYEDECLAVIDKPQGMTVMGERPSLGRSDLLLALAGGDASGKGGGAMTKPVHVHRLDAPTGGLLVLAKTKAAEIQLKKCFASRSCQKRYLALALGRIEPQEGTIDVAISGKDATTKYKVVQYSRCDDEMVADDGWVTLVDLYPVTGRHHQLRRHLKHIGHAIWGDYKYAPYHRKNSKRKAPSLSSSDNSDMSNRADVVNSTTVEQDPHARLCLWAVEISFPHPTSGVNVTVALEERPEWLTSLLDHHAKSLRPERDVLPS